MRTPDEAEELDEGSEGKSMTFWEHVEELAHRLRVAMYTFFASAVVMMVLPADFSFLNNPIEFYQPLVGVILKRVRQEILPPNVRLIGMEMTSPIELYMIASFIFGAALSSPVAAYEVYRFVEPALYPNEKKDLYPFLVSFWTLFLTGLVFGYKVLVPYLVWAMMPFFSAVGAELLISIMDFYTLVLVTTLAIGFFFTFPVFFVLLVKHGIIDTGVVTNYRRYVYAGLFILICFITPDGGHIGNFILFVPTVLLIEGGVFFAKRYEKRDMARKPRWFTERPKCKFCGEMLQADATFCPKCGKSQK